MMKYIRNNKIEAVELGDELGMLNVETSMYYILDSISKDIWHLLTTERTVDDLVSTMMKEYEVSEEVCRRDVNKLMEDMINKELVEIR